MLRVFLAITLALLTRGAIAQAGGACGCDDVRDLRNRICEARAAISEYDRQIDRIQRYERETLKKPLLYTEKLYEERMQPCIQEAINTVTDSGARVGTARTDNACNIVFDKPPPTRCLAESLSRHERFHQTECMAMRQTRDEKSLFGPFLSLFEDTRAGQSLASLALEEKFAYRNEIDHNLEQLRRLSTVCPRSFFEVERAGRREFTIDYCPAARPRPKPEESSCPPPPR
jgi:hypothetical protein